MAETTKSSKGESPQTPESAGAKENQALEHSVEGSTTRDDNLDVGVPMLQGDPSEPAGPEDALGEGPKRGDYTSRQDGADHYETVRNPRGGEPVRDGDGNIVDLEPLYVLRRQNERVNDIGEEPGKKGGVDTAEVAP